MPTFLEPQCDQSAEMDASDSPPELPIADSEHQYITTDHDADSLDLDERSDNIFKDTG